MDGVILDEDAKREQMQMYLLQSSRIEIPQAKAQQTTTGKITDILVDNRQEKITIFEEQELCEYDGIRFKLTDMGMDVYNSIISELMK